jgi:thiamine pyrophosphokinase
VQEKTVVVVAGGGDVRDVSLRGQTLLRDAPVIAADGGVDLALALGLRVDAVVGDFDSASADAVAAAEADGARIVRHPAEKDATDLELALDEALVLEPRRIVVVGTQEGRLDHLLGALLLLGAEKYAAVELDALFGAASVHVVRGRRELAAREGELISLHALHGPAEGVETDGLRYPLRGETLAAGSSRGVSNEFAAPAASVSVRRGVLLAVRPGHVR